MLSLHQYYYQDISIKKLQRQLLLRDNETKKLKEELASLVHTTASTATQTAPLVTIRAKVITPAVRNKTGTTCTTGMLPGTDAGEAYFVLLSKLTDIANKFVGPYVLNVTAIASNAALSALQKGQPRNVMLLRVIFSVVACSKPSPSVQLDVT